MIRLENQILRVRSNEEDGDDSGRHWQVHYVLTEEENVEDSPEFKPFHLWTDDGFGNGILVCVGSNKTQMVSLTLKLGTFIAWRG